MSDGRGTSPDERLDREPFCYLTTTGRRTGRPHTIEIWFALHGASVYLLSGRGDRADWVRNLAASPEAGLRIGTQSFAVRGRVVTEADEAGVARRLLAAKYETSYGGDLGGWLATALPVALDMVGHGQDRQST